jgi:hypothetical protein
MRVVAIKAPVFHGLMLHLGFFKRIIVALEAERPAVFYEQLLDVRSVRAVAIRALAAFHRIMLELGGLEGLLDIGVARKAGIGQRFFQQTLDARAVRVVACQAFAFRGRMFHFHLGDRIIVALEAQPPANLDEEFRVWRLVRVVTGRALAHRSRVMRVFHLCQKVGVALKTKSRQ